MSLQKWIYMGSGRDVDHVMVNGKLVMKDRKAVQVDEDAILQQADAVFNDTIQRAHAEEFIQPSDTFWGSTLMSLKQARKFN
jgi:cytosine/adenosine deaminase-related metal-dependent hydrolase